MDAATKPDVKKASKIKYKERTEEDKKKLLNEKDKKNTQAATDRAVSHFRKFLQVKSIGELECLDPSKLNTTLSDYYCSVQPQKSNDENNDKYSVQSMKCMRAALNRYFRKDKDEAFIQANEMFKAVCVESKKAGKGVKKSYPPISPIDLECIAEYFLL